MLCACWQIRALDTYAVVVLNDNSRCNEMDREIVVLCSYVASVRFLLRNDTVDRIRSCDLEIRETEVCWLYNESTGMLAAEATILDG